MLDLLIFAREFVRSPWTTASPLPTSSAACEVALSPLPAHGDPVVLELGAGAGATSSVVARRLDGRGRHIAVEVNPRLASALSRRHPDVEVMCDEAVSAMAELAASGTSVDLVFSTLPISLAEDRSFLVAAGALLTPTGALSQVQHSWTRPLPWAKAAERALGDAFEEVVVSRTIWRNVPPATVTIARRPREHVVRPADR
ncbi:class I SAM-dependent methyltransferase [Actinomycetospora chiangmaiensis]|uniref:class I SAM-dependent methyltransferase n=1 Tax=Actinomycetospora chiangmaiensis TaxID=402650 RepID=UPI0003708213|nr:methyltransferase domain-containing protein [Actinomycetospora chiangmaiensis]